MWALLHKLFLMVAQYRYLDNKFCVLYFLLIMSSWIIYKNECIISYYWKHKNYDNYKLGDDPHDVSDLGLKDNYLTLFFYDLMKVIITPYLFYKITGDVKSMLLYQTVIFLTLSNKEYSNYFFKTRFRYILLVVVCYLITNKIFINDNYMNMIVKIGSLILTGLIIYTYNNYKNIIDDLDEISYVGILQIAYILGKFIKN